jgi:hypothetical protein
MTWDRARIQLGQVSDGEGADHRAERLGVLGNGKGLQVRAPFLAAPGLDDDHAHINVCNEPDRGKCRVGARAQHTARSERRSGGEHRKAGDGQDLEDSGGLTLRSHRRSRPVQARLPPPNYTFVTSVGESSRLEPAVLSRSAAI